MADVGEARVKITGDSSSLESDLIRTAGNIGKAFAAIKVGAAAFDFLKGGIQQLGELEKATAQTNAVIKSTGGIANVSSASVVAFGDKIEKLTGIDQTQIQTGENLLLTFKGIRNEAGKGNDIFNQARKVAVDLSVAWGQDMSTSAIQLGKALENPVVGMTALQRVGVTFTESQKETVKELVETGKTLEAQKLILKEVETQVGGSAKAYGETLPAKLAVAQQSIEDVQQNIAAAFVPALLLSADAVGALSTEFQKLPDPVRIGVGALIGLTAVAGSIVAPLNSGIQIWKTFHPVVKAAGDSAQAASVGLQAAGASATGMGAAIATTTGVVALGVAAGLGLAAVAAKLTGGMDGSKVSIDGFTDSLIKMPAAEAAQKLGQVDQELFGLVVSWRDNTSAVQGHDAALKVFNETAGKNLGAAIAIRDEYVQHPKLLADMGVKLSELNAIIADNSVKLAASRGVTEGSRAAQDAWGEAFAQAAFKVDQAKLQVDNFKLSIEASIGPTLGLLGANISYQEQVDKLTQSLVDNGATFDLNEQSGRANASMLGQLVADTISTTEQTIRQTGAVAGSADAMFIATGRAQQLAGDILSSGAAAGISAQDMVRYAGEIGLIPPEAVTAILNNADVQAGLVQYFSNVLAGVNGQHSETSVTNTITTVYRTVGSAFSGGLGIASGALGKFGWAKGGIAGAADGEVVRGPAVRLIGEAGPEAVVPLGNSSTNKRDRWRVMKQAGLAWASGGIAGSLLVGGRWLPKSDIKKWLLAGGTFNDDLTVSPTTLGLKFDYAANRWVEAGGGGGGSRPKSAPKAPSRSILANRSVRQASPKAPSMAHLSTAPVISRVSTPSTAMGGSDAKLDRIIDILSRIEANQKGTGKTGPSRAIIGARA